MSVARTDPLSMPARTTFAPVRFAIVSVNGSSAFKMTVPLGLQLFLGQQGQRWDLLMAASTIAMVPTVVLVLALQKYLVKGIALSGLGGR